MTIFPAVYAGQQRVRMTPRQAFICAVNLLELRCRQVDDIALSEHPDWAEFRRLFATLPGPDHAGDFLGFATQWILRYGAPPALLEIPPIKRLGSPSGFV